MKPEEESKDGGLPPIEINLPPCDAGNPFNPFTHQQISDGILRIYDEYIVIRGKEIATSLAKKGKAQTEDEKLDADTQLWDAEVKWRPIITSHILVGDIPFDISLQLEQLILPTQQYLVPFAEGTELPSGFRAQAHQGHNEQEEKVYNMTLPSLALTVSSPNKNTQAVYTVRIPLRDEMRGILIVDPDGDIDFEGIVNPPNPIDPETPRLLILPSRTGILRGMTMTITPHENKIDGSTTSDPSETP